MYMSNSTPEKLLDILHNKVIGATIQGTAPGLINVKRARNTSSSSVDKGEEDVKDHREEREEEDEEDDDNVDERGGTAYKKKVPEWFTLVEKAIKLSGPVTDL